MIDTSISTTDRIHPDKKGLFTYMDELRSRKYQIPTFQRDVVWDDLSVKKLWDSIYKYYPLGSILVWKTDMKLQKHREIGGHPIDDSENLKEFNYILDGQQRTTSLLTSLFGGTITSKPGFKPELYVDLTVESEDDTDDDSFKRRFLFWREIDNSTDKRNNSKKANYDKGLIVRLIDIKENFTTVQKRLMNHLNSGGLDFEQILEHSYNKQLTKLHETLEHYMLSFIEIQGIQVAEVCQIFERINQAGKPLDIFDIVVAKTFVPDNPVSGTNGFYLRELIDDFKNEKGNNSKFFGISDLTYLQIIATIVKNSIENSGIHNITDRYLNELTSDHIKVVWGDTKVAIKKTFDFFENYLHINPQLVPYRYFYLVFPVYFYKNDNPDYTFLKRFFWYTSFHKSDLLSNTTELSEKITFIKDESPQFGVFQIDKNDLRTSKYSSRGRLSSAILALYANAKPKDWTEPDREVIVSNFFFTTDKPNLHHIFPTKSEYIKTGNFDNDSLMNIAYITQATNLDILAKDAIDYVKDYDSDEFRNKVLPTHFINEKIAEWSKNNSMPSDAFEIFIEDRVNAIIERIIGKQNEEGEYVGGFLSGLRCNIIDTRFDVEKTML